MRPAPLPKTPLIAALILALAGPSSADAGPWPGVSGSVIAFLNRDGRPVPPLPPIDAPPRTFREALGHLTLLEAEYFESEVDRLDEGTFDLGLYNEMYEFFRVESRRLSEAYPDEKFSYDTPELSAARDRINRARQDFQASRFRVEQEENRRKLGLEPDDPRTYVDRARDLMNLFTDHYLDAASRIAGAGPERIAEFDRAIRSSDLLLSRDLRRLAVDFPNEPPLFEATFDDPDLRATQRSMLDALDSYRDARSRNRRADRP